MNWFFALAGIILLIGGVHVKALTVLEPEAKEFKILAEGDTNFSKTVLVKNEDEAAILDLNVELIPDVNGIKAGLVEKVLNRGDEATILVSIVPSNLKEGITKTFLSITNEGQEIERIKIEVEKADEKQTSINEARRIVKNNPWLLAIASLLTVIGLILVVGSLFQAFDSLNQNIGFFIIGLLAIILGLGGLI